MSGRAATDEIIAGDYAMSVGRAEMRTPPGWQWVCLTDIARLETGHTPSRKHPEYWDGDIPWVGIRDANVNHGGIIESTFQHVTEFGLENSAARLLPANTVCLSRTASVGYVVILGRPMATSQDFVCWVCSNAVLPRFLMYLLLAERESLPRFGRGSTHTTIYFPEVKAFHICLPPLPEQRRIVAKLDLLLAKVSSSQQRLSRIPALMKRFRQSVLAAACSGRLTADWREDDSWEDELPIGWQRIVLNELLPRGGIFDGPFGSNLKTSDYSGSGIRVVRLENIGHLEFNAEKETFISKDKYETLTKHTISEGDIIFASFISEEVRACVLPKLATTAIAKADCFCLRPFLDRVDRTYLTYQLVSQESFDSLVEEVHGATRPRINTTQLRNLTIRVAPLPEQHEIVRRVEKLFAFADQIEARLKHAQAHVDRLTQSLLAKAFRGELVPTEHALAEREGREYETAEKLLARIRAAKNDGRSNANKKGRRQTGAKA